MLGVGPRLGVCWNQPGIPWGLLFEEREMYSRLPQYPSLPQGTIGCVAGGHDIKRMCLWSWEGQEGGEREEIGEQARERREWRGRERKREIILLCG